MVKPTKMRNRMIFQATMQTRSKQLGANLSKDLQKKYGKKSARVVEGDSVTCLLYTSPSPRDQRGSRMPSSA